MANQIDLESKYIILISGILKKCLPKDAKVFLFGSRSTGSAKPFSDIDLLIDIGQPLSIKQLADLTVDLDESLIPYKVDLVDAWAISDEFKIAINEQLLPFNFSI